MRIRDGASEDLPVLSALALRSKGHWGYPDPMLVAMRDELTWTEEDHGRFVFRVAELGGQLVGFSALAKPTGGRTELEALFVAPEHIGRGAGRALMDDAVVIARGLGATVMDIQSDPNAEPFYLAAGAVRVGERPSDSIAGRDLPLLELDLATDRG